MNKTIMQKINTFFWFDDAEAAAEFYTSIFKNSDHRYISLREISGKDLWKTFTPELDIGVKLENIFILSIQY
jgi:hypothetical protein